MSSGESYDETAPRELHEELGIQAALTPVRKFDACAETCHEFTWLYTAQSDETVNADPEEIADTRWLTPAEVAAEIATTPDSFSPAFRLLFAAWRTHAD